MKLFSRPFALFLAAALVLSTFAFAFVTMAEEGDIQPGQNLLTNGGFETGSFGELPDGWTVTGINGTIDTNGPQEGNNLLCIWNNDEEIEEFDVTVTQTITGLPAGIYELSSYTKSWSSYQFIMFVKDHGGSQITIDVSRTGDWAINTLGNIPVTSGQATIGFRFVGPAGGGGSIDNVEFKLVELGAPSIEEPESEEPESEEPESEEPESEEPESEEPSEEESEEPSQAESEEPSQAESEEPSQAESEEPSQTESETGSNTESKDPAQTGDNNIMMYGLLVLAVAAAAIFVTVPKKANN